MKINLKAIAFMAIIFITVDVSAQFSIPSIASPRRVARHAASAARHADDAVETVQDVNEVVNAINSARKMIDSLVAKDKSKTPGQVHLIFVGIDYNNENLIPVNDALKNVKDVSDVQKVQKNGSVTFTLKSQLIPIDIWKNLPKKVQKEYIIHDKDACNVVLLYKVPPTKPKK